MTARIGLRELRLDAAHLVRRVERGEEIEIEVGGRTVARLVPVTRRQWLSWDEIADIFDGRPDSHWDKDQDLIDQSLNDPLISSSGENLPLDR